MSSFNAVGKDGLTRTFIYETYFYEDQYNKITKTCFRITELGASYSNWFDFKVSPIGSSIIKVTDMFLEAPNSFYKGKGIPENMILELKKLFPGKKIISSSNKKNVLRNEWRSAEGTSVWKRLEKQGLAVYRSESDTFILR